MGSLIYFYIIKLVGAGCITLGFLNAAASNYIVEKFGYIFSIFLMFIVVIVGLLFMYDVFSDVLLIANSK